MGGADLVVMLLYGGGFTRLQHGDHVRLRRQLKEVVVVPRIGSKRLFVAFEQFHLAMDCEHLFDEGAPEMQQAQGKRSLVVRAQGLMCFLEELSQIGAQLDNTGVLTAPRAYN